MKKKMLEQQAQQQVKTPPKPEEKKAPSPISLYRGRKQVDVPQDSSDEDGRGKGGKIAAGPTSAIKSRSRQMRMGEDSPLSSLLSKTQQPQIDLTPYATNKHLDEVRTRFSKDIDELNLNFKRVNQLIGSNQTEVNSELDQIKTQMKSIENEVQQKLAQMFMEMEGFIKARKRDKNDQNAIIRKLRN